MAFVYLYMDSQRLNFKLDSQREEVSESKSRLHNLTAEVEQLTSYPRILRKIAEFKLGLRERIPGQVKNVRHLHADEYLPAQTLRDEAPTTVASRR
jgi:cell division protein FtsL